ncbi:hypothetical protein [Mycolicibacterium tokaiense]|uniref:Uncharacterized protein n=1 Tax=Mycolicibacterium tokaiense TaxID=39695 RepID=A0A378TLR1_9MYCO|nr:hypothetical protein [Mycolicibacterium tokaiense]BBY84701.1 hypothetical protein MTOK_04830 [Mycolicibacterium tokaiense]STZ60793.1 Uncharacterised protein [Mycolicibacterium tokaiense]
MNQAELIATVAGAAVKATLSASASPKTLKPPTTARPSVKPLSAPTPIKPPRRALTAADRDRLALAVHESGHCVAATLYGAQVLSSVVYEAGDGFNGMTTYHGDTVPPGRELEFCYSGPYAEARWLAGGQHPTARQFHDVWSGHGRKDAATLNLAGGTHQGAGVAPLIAHCWPSVQTLAKKLYRAGEIHHEDVLAALGVNPKRPIGSQLSSIRAGTQTVPPFIPSTPV